MRQTTKFTIKFFIVCLIFIWLFAGQPQIFNFPPRIEEAHASTETIRPADAYNPENWGTPSQGYDGNTSTSASSSNSNATPSISFGGDIAAEGTNDWQAKGQSWDSATFYFSFSKAAATDDTVEVIICEYSGGTCTTKHTLITSTSSAVAKIERSQVLTAADWGGAGFPNMANLRVRVNGTKAAKPDNATAYMYDIRIDGEYTAGILTVDIVDSGSSPVASPSMAMNAVTFSFNSQTAAGTFGTASEKVRVDNGTASSIWTLSLAASVTTNVWNSAGTDYDFNDPTAGAEDGADADSVGGQMTVDPSVSTITPQGGCSNTGLSKGSSTGFSEGVTDSITLVTADGTADTGCYWDITGIGISQTIPAEQPVASDYNINMVVSVVAS